jgi:hypothetical protein
MKSSLVSATSLMALLAFEVTPAQATPDFDLISGTSCTAPDTSCTLTFYALPNATTASQTIGLQADKNLNGSQTLGSVSGSFNSPGNAHNAPLANGSSISAAYTFTGQPSASSSGSSQTSVTTVGGSAGTPSTTQNQTSIITLIGNTVAPIDASSGGNAGYALVGNSSSVLVTVNNTGHGNLSGAGTVSNLNGSIASASGLFTGAGGTVSMLDTSSTTISYTFAPTVRGTASTTVTGTFSNGDATGGNAAHSDTLTLTGTGVAPVQSVSVANNGAPGSTPGTGQLGYVLVKSTANPGATASATLTVNNIGNGDLAGTDSSTLQTNLHGTQGASGSSVFVGSGGTVNLQDVNGAGGSTTASFTYNFAPTSSGAQSTAVTTTFTNGSTNNQNQAGTVTTTISGTGVAPINSMTVTNTGTAGNTPGTGNVGYVLVQSTASVAITIQNKGNGNLAGYQGGNTNLNGSIGSASGPAGTAFTGSGTSYSLQDSNATTALGFATAGATTQTTTYNYAPTVTGSTTTTITTANTNGSPDGLNNGTTATTTLTGTAVAPINSISSTNVISRANGYGGANAGTGTATVTVNNIGNGNKSGLGTISNLNASSITGPTPPPFTGAGGNATSLSLADGGSTVLSYVYAPTARGTNTGVVTTNFSNGNSAGTNLSQSVATTITGTGVGPIYQSKVGSGSPTTIDTPTPNTGTSTINFGSLTYKSSSTMLLSLGNITADLNGGNTKLTDLTLESESLTGVNAADFSISGFTPGQVIAEGGSAVTLTLSVSAAQLGSLSGTLVFTTDEDAAYGATGDTFTYNLSALSTSGVPEPASLAVLGAGLAGLGAVRRRRRAQ